MDGPSDARGIGLPIGLIVKNEDSCVKAVLQQSGNEPQPATKKKKKPYDVGPERTLASAAALATVFSS